MIDSSGNESQIGTIGGWRKVTDPRELASLAAEQAAYLQQRRGRWRFYEPAPAVADSGLPRVTAPLAVIAEEPAGARITTVLPAIVLNGGDRTPYIHRGTSSDAKAAEPAEKRADQAASTTSHAHAYFIPVRREGADEIPYYHPPQPDISEYMTEPLAVVTPPSPDTFGHRIQHFFDKARGWLAEKGQIVTSKLQRSEQDLAEWEEQFWKGVERRFYKNTSWETEVAVLNRLGSSQQTIAEAYAERQAWEAERFPAALARKMTAFLSERIGSNLLDGPMLQVPEVNSVAMETLLEESAAIDRQRRSTGLKGYQTPYGWHRF